MNHPRTAPERIVLPPYKVRDLPDDPATREERYHLLAAEIAEWAKDEDEFPFELDMLEDA